MSALSCHPKPNKLLDSVLCFTYFFPGSVNYSPSTVLTSSTIRTRAKKYKPASLPAKDKTLWRPVPFRKQSKAEKRKKSLFSIFDSGLNRVSLFSMNDWKNGHLFLFEREGGREREWDGVVYFLRPLHCRINWPFLNYMPTHFTLFLSLSCTIKVSKFSIFWHLLWQN